MPKKCEKNWKFGKLYKLLEILKDLRSEKISEIIRLTIYDDYLKWRPDSGC